MKTLFDARATLRGTFLLLAGLAVNSAVIAAGPGKAAIATASHFATDAGFEVIAKGGNAFDAAIAVSATLSVVEPQSSGIGGGGFFLLHRASDGEEIMLDARETAPAAANTSVYMKADGSADRDKSINGPLSAAIPGEPAALVWLAEHYGKLPLKVSLAPAIRLASKGFKPDERFTEAITRRRDVLARYPGSKSLYMFKGEPPKDGWMFRNPDLAKLLENIAAHGNDAFYRGDFAKLMVDGVRAAGGNWVLDDLDKYEVKTRVPIRIDYRGYRIVTAPPPSSGGVAIAEMLNILGGYDFSKIDSTKRIHLIVESMRRAYRDRAQYLGDPDFVDVPVDMLTSPLYAAGLRATIHPEKATPSDLLPPFLSPPQGPDTTHYSIIDSDGNMVSTTQTVNTSLGSGFVVAGTGFVMNNEMDDFALVAGVPNFFGLPGGEANAPEPGRRPLSSMTPSFVYGKDRVGVIGVPGGSRIITMVLEGILAFVDGELPEQIVANKRFHHQYLPDVVYAEAGALTPEQVTGLSAMGHVVKDQQNSWGFMNMVSWDKASNMLHAASDPRWPDGSGKVK
ncbi:MAG: gamma-glutamyltransferase [Dokdonella sp.]